MIFSINAPLNETSFSNKPHAPKYASRIKKIELLLKRNKTLIEFFLFYSEYRNPFEISEEDMTAAAAPFFSVIEEDKDDDIELDIM